MRDIIIFLDLDNTGSAPQFLEAAQSLQLKPIMLSINPWLYSDVPVANAIRMREMTVGSVIAAIDRIGRERVAGVFTPRSLYTELAARAAQAIGRPHSDPDSIAICHDKLRARRVLESKGFTDVAYKNVASAEEAYVFAKDLGGKVVLKPSTSSGTAGVKICKTPDYAHAYAKYLLRRKPNGVLIEEFIQGPLFAIEAFHGKVFGIRRLFVTDNPSPICIGREAPANLPADIHRSLAAHTEEALELIGYSRGVAHVQAVYANDGPYLIEINPRVPAGMSPANIKAGFGIDVAQIGLRFSCGLPVTIDVPNSHNPKHYAASRSLLRINKSIQAIHGVEDASRIPHVVEVSLLPAKFGRRGQVSSTSDRVAYVQSVADTAELATESANSALSKLSQVPESSIRYWLRRLRAKLMRKIMRRLTYGRAT